MGAITGRSRLAWSFGDQALSSLTNFVLTVAVARSVSAADFGAFALVMGAYLLLLFAARGLTSDPLVAEYSGSLDSRQLLRCISDSLGACLALSLLFGAGTVLVAILAPSVGWLLIAFAISLPGILIQDHVRFIAFTEGAPTKAFASDLLWFVMQISGLVLLSLLEVDSVYFFVAVWGLSATVAGIFGLTVLKVLPRILGARRWLHSVRGLWPFYLLENVLLQGVNLVILAGVAALAGLTDAGAIRGAVTLFTPLALLAAGVQSAGVPELTRLAARSATRVRPIALTVGGALAAGAALWTVGLLSMPASVGSSLLGESWPDASRLILFVGIDTLATLFVLGPFMGLRALRKTQGMSTRGWLGLARTVSAVTSSEFAGARGAVVAFAVLAPVQMATWVLVLVRASPALELKHSRRRWRQP